MTQSDDQQKRDQLHDLLIELAQSQEFLSPNTDHTSYFERLEDIYHNCNDENENFRHYYSDIFSTLSLIDGDSSLGSLDVLAQNIKAIKDEYQTINKDGHGKPINIGKQIQKLYDHTNLEIARINYNHSVTNHTESQLAKTKALVEQLNTRIQEHEISMQQMTKDNIANVTKLSSDIQSSQKEMQKDYISILGIFASIVLSFTAGMAFSSSILENIGSATSYRLVLISLIIGIVLFNIIWIMIDFIRDICDKNSTSVIGKHKFPVKWIWLFLVNSILVSGIVLTCFAYKYDWFARDIDSNHTLTPNTSQAEDTIPPTTEAVETSVVKQPAS